MKNIFFASMVVLILFSSGFAQEQTGIRPDAKSLLQEKIDAVLDILQLEDLTDAQKKERIEKIVDPVFNYELTAMLALGKQNWAKLNPEQRDQFTSRFVTRLKNSYFDKIALYQGDTDAQITYGDARNEGNKVHVPVKVRTKGDTVEMSYKFYQSGSDWRIYDVEINGVSIVQSYRTQFNQVLSRGTVEDLLRELKAPANP